MVGERRRLRRRRGVGRGVARVATPLVVATALVLLAFGAVAHIGPASGPDRRTVDRSFVVLAAPVVAQSNATGSLLNTIMGRAPSIERVNLFADLASLTADTAEEDRQFAALTPPLPSADAAELCGAAIDGRARGAGEVSDAFAHLLGGRRGVGGGDEAAAAHALADARATLRSADDSWAACRRALRRGPGSALLPPSRWLSRPALWDETALGQLVSAAVGSPALEPVHRLVFVALSTDPASVPGASGVTVLPPTDAVRLRVVVADQGNVDEPDVTLTVTAVPQGNGSTPSPVRTRTNIGAGDSVALAAPPLSVRPGRSYVLDISAAGREAGAQASITLSVQVSASPPPSTTTTTTTTTRPRTTAPLTSTTVRPG